ncbi:hypothetical protein VQ02_18570 [Methylobacterium variabile]|uniref:Uncharacterized protein n=1 Tax=Methylobacterium variabile TaxID=298794 RepID=A0A0J6SMX9_9HYPH|nr:hypothetical protein VQ02_18570 [Methylobacterium variabile]
MRTDIDRFICFDRPLLLLTEDDAVATARVDDVVSSSSAQSSKVEAWEDRIAHEFCERADSGLLAVRWKALQCL